MHLLVGSCSERRGKRMLAASLQVISPGKDQWARGLASQGE